MSTYHKTDYTKTNLILSHNTLYINVFDIHQVQQEIFPRAFFCMVSYLCGMWQKATFILHSFTDQHYVVIYSHMFFFPLKVKTFLFKKRNPKGHHQPPMKVFVLNQTLCWNKQYVRHTNEREGKKIVYILQRRGKNG